MPNLRDQQLRSFLLNEGVFATSLLAIVFDKFGTEVTEWEPETLDMEIRDGFGATLPQVNKDKLWALITALTTNQFYVSMEAFNAITQALNDEESEFQIFSPISVEGAAWAITEVTLSDPDGGEWSPEIKAWLGVLIDNRGLLEVPPILNMAEPSGRLTEGATQFADDVTFYEAIWSVQKSNSESITEYVEIRLNSLFKELSRLPLSLPVDLSQFKVPSLS
jgi:hypothetical protein